MGCDIHLFVEYKEKNFEHWQNYGEEFRLTRIYGMFATMANVRNHFDEDYAMFEPKGLPEMIGTNTKWANQLYITTEAGEGQTTPEQALNWVERGYSTYTDERKVFVTNPDWHSHSWLTLAEYEQCFYRVFNKNSILSGDYIEYAVLLDLLKSFERYQYDVRIVFWFDN